jgi:ubiquinone biosynthesis monooxygenase Coq7
MKEDEIKHAHMAHDFGAAELPAIVVKTMQATSKVMTGAAYRI